MFTPFRSSETPWQTTELNLRATGEDAELAVTQHHQTMANRDLIKVFQYRSVRDRGVRKEAASKKLSADALSAPDELR